MPIAPRDGNTLGLDIGGTKTLAAVLDDQGDVVALHKQPTPVGQPADVTLVQLGELARRLRADHPLAALGIGFPGLVDSTRGVARSSVILPEWREVEVTAFFEQQLALPCALDNDVNHAARAEARLRPGEDLLFVAVGTGIGAAIVVDGRLWSGAGGLAGELGHLSIDRNGPLCACGRHGCLNMLASGTAIEKALGLAHGTLPAAVASDTPAVRAAVRAAADALGHGLADAMNLMSFPLIVLGGGVAQIGPTYLEQVRQTAFAQAFEEIAAATRIETARADYEAGAVGAALFAREQLARG